MNHQKGSNCFSKVYLIVCSVLVAVVFIAVCIFSLFAQRIENKSFFNTTSKYLSEGWVDGDGNVVTLPKKLPYPQSGAYTFSTVVPKQDFLEQNISLLFSAKYMNISLFLDGEEIASGLGESDKTKKLRGKIFLMMALPEDAVGKELCIVAVPLLGKELNYEINAPMIGTGERIIYDFIRSNIPMLVILEAIFCFGILLMLFSWQARKTGNGTFFQTGMFAILFAMYSFCITDTIHLFLDNSQFIYMMEFLLLALVPLPLLVLIYHVCLAKFRTILLANIGLLTFNFCLQVALYYFSELELRDTVKITHIVLVISVLVLILVLAISGRKGEERFRLLISFLPVLLGATWDIAQFYLPGIYQKALGFQVGVLIFISLQTIYLIRSYLESDLYRKVAYTDALTGLQNRTAFEEKIVQLNKTASHYASVWCVCADVNYLKRVNDTLGHSAGDELIRGAARVLHELKSKDGRIYRTGGDEFVLFEFNQSEESMGERFTHFNEALRRYNQNHDVLLSIAIGYDRLCKGDTITKLISHADSMMYEDKHRQKEEQPKNE